LALVQRYCEAIAARKVSHRVLPLSAPPAILGRLAFRSEGTDPRIVEPHRLEKFHRPSRGHERERHGGCTEPFSRAPLVAAARPDPTTIMGSRSPAAQERDMAQQPELPKDWLEFMHKMWNPMSFPIPGMALPTANAEEVGKKIAELKAVETWLTMQLGFVQMTIKTLEMQKAALESISGASGKKPESGA
jgi:hypothetical protein